MIPAIALYLELEKEEIYLLGTSYYLGLTIGCFLRGIFGEIYGRKTLLLLAMIPQIILSIWTLVLKNLILVVISRVFFGIIHGFCQKISQILIVEILPKSRRGALGTSYELFTTFGIYLFLIMGYIFMDDLYSGNWQAILIIGVITLIVAFILTNIFVLESPRYLLFAHEYQ